MKKYSFFVLIALLSPLFVTGCHTTAGRKGHGKSIKKEVPEFKKAYINEKKLQKVWVSKPDLRVPESVIYDKTGNVIYVSNINGNPGKKDGNGFISKLSPDGHILVRKWVTGLDAPKGLSVVGDKLYVSDIQSLVEISIPSQKVVARYRDTLARFLNDVAVDTAGNVYVSDMGASAIYRLHNGVFEKWLQNKRLTSPNGLYVEGNNLLAGLKDRIVSIDLSSRKIRDYILHTGSIDGLESDGRGHYLISDWSGHVYLAGPDMKKILLLNTVPIHMQAADIDFVKSTGMLLVPTFNNNRVVAYRYIY